MKILLTSLLPQMQQDRNSLTLHTLSVWTTVLSV
jgi:hypothetical protein